MRLIPSLVVLALVSCPLAAQDLASIGSVGQTVTLTLTNGDTITGTLIENTGTTLVIKSELLGRLTIPRVGIVVPDLAAPDEVVVETAWGGTADLSFRGNSGNTSNLAAHVEINLRRETEEVIDSVLITADRKTERVNEAVAPGTNRTVTDRRRYGRFRREWKSLESDWRPFFEVSTDHDFQKTYNELVTVAGGAGYLFFDEADETLLGRIGAAETKKVKSATKATRHWTTEALLGLDYRLDITDRQHLAAETTVFPSIRDAGEYRMVSKAEWRMDLSDDSPWYYKIGVNNSYDSSAAKGTDKSDVGYHMGVGTVF
jgi:hypothetical protein